MEVFARTPVDLDSMETPRGEVYIILERCKACTPCVEVRPQQVLQLSTA